MSGDGIVTDHSYARAPALSSAAWINKPPRRDRIVTLAVVSAVAAAGWLYLVLEAVREPVQMDFHPAGMMAMPSWTPSHALFAWATMTVTMMLPSAAVAIARSLGRPLTSGLARTAAAGLFTAGYLVVWMVFCVAAAWLQGMLAVRHLLSGTMAIRDATSAALLLVVVGIYQLSGLKRISVRRCHLSGAGPIGSGELSRPLAGIRYGISCLGCCALPMGLMFVGGVMNLLWMAMLSVLVFAEKNFSWGGRLSRFTGIGVVAWGTVSLAVAGGHWP